MLAIVNGKVMTITNGTIDNGTVLIKDGKIVAVGDKNLPIPDGVYVIDARDMVVTPGLIDAHAHLGLFGEIMMPATSEGNEMTAPVQPMIRGIDSMNPDDPAFKLSLEAGVTTVYVTPGSANVIGGTGVAVKTYGRTVYDMVIPGTEAMKMALGENPKNVYGSLQMMPSTRMGNAAVLRKTLIKAQSYMEKIKRAKAEAKDGEEPKLPDRDPSLDALAKVLRREMKARIHAHRADDIMTAIRIAEEFNLDYTIEHVTEGYHIANILAEKQVPCIVGPLIIDPYKQEIWDVRVSTPGVLSQAGAKVVITMDAVHPSSHTRWLSVHAGLAVRFGMDEEEAFKAITINAAEVLGLDNRLGSLEAGKDADVVIFDGHPLSNFTFANKVIVGGKVVFDRDK